MDGSEQDMLKQVVAKKQRLSKYQDKQKLQHYLLQQGFSYDLVKATIVQTSFDSAQNDTQ
jgi:SOS response regulatory protein OraA/RecX